jgi:hypothetical protein
MLGELDRNSVDKGEVFKQFSEVQGKINLI